MARSSAPAQHHAIDAIKLSTLFGPGMTRSQIPHTSAAHH